MHSASPASPSSVEFRLLGETALPACLELQDRLWREMVATPERRIVVLVAEHPRSLTIGRQGSRAHIGLSDKQLNRRQLSPRWVSRGGGCVLHAPGQIAVYFVAPLQPLNWTVNDALWRIQTGLIETLDQLQIPTRVPPRRFGAWGRSGQLAAVGVSVRNWITRFGFYLNVNPSMTDFSAVQTAADVGQSLHDDPDELPGTMGCLVSERKQAGKMAKTRAILIEQLGESLDCPRYHVHTGHPQLAAITRAIHESSGF